MLPRTQRKRGKLHETYQCRTAKILGAEACPMPIFLREAVEVPALAMFEKSVLDFEATREHIAGQLDARINEATAQATRANREATDLRTQTDRVERDYRRGALPAENYARLRTDIADELAAAEAEAKRLTAHADAMAGTRSNLNAEDEALQRLTDLRAAVAGQVTGAGTDVGALRSAMAAVFECFSVDPERLGPEPGGWHVVPWLRPGTYDGVICEPVEALNEKLAALPLRRVPIAFGMEAENNQHGTELWKYMTQKTFRLS